MMKPNTKELRTALRAKNPSKSYGSLWIESNPRRDGRFYVHYKECADGIPFDQFCNEYGINSDYISTSERVVTESETIQGVNRLKNNTIQRLEYGNNSQIISDYARKITAPFEVAQSLIRPIDWYEVNQRKVRTPSFQIGCKHFIPNQKNDKGEKTTLKFWVYTVHNYLFPLHHLGDKARDRRLLENKKHFVFCEGENDVNCFNYHFQDTPFFAVTVGGVQAWTKATEQKKYLNELLPNAKWITLFDNDLAGNSTIVEGTVRAHVFKNENKGFDVCDAFQKYPNAKELILLALNDATIDKSITINVDNYIGEKFDEVVDYIANSRKVLIHANTGTGKTYFVGNMANEITFQKLGIQRIIYVVPRRLLSMDISKDLTKRGVSAIILKRSHAKCDLLDYKVVITTVDSLPLLDTLLDSSLVVLDEPQKHESDMSFRIVPRNILSRLDFAAKVVAITATPNLDLYKILGFSYMRVNAEKRTKHVKVTFLSFDKMTYVAAILGQIKGKTAILLQDKSDLYEIQRALPHLESIVICADTVEHVMTQDLAQFDLFLCTSVVDAGINFHFHIDTFIAPFATRVCDLAQFVGRNRTDLERNLIALRKNSEKEPEKMGTSNFFKAAAQIQKCCDTCNESQNDIPYEKYDRKPMETVYTYYNNNMYCIDYLTLANNCYVHPLTFDEMFERLRGFDDAFQSFEIRTGFENIQLEQLAKEEAKVTRKEREAVKIEVLQQISNDVETFCQVIANGTKSESLKEQIEIHCKLHPKAEINLINKDCQYSQVLAVGEKLVKQYVDIVQFHTPKSTAFLGLPELQKTRFKAVLMTQLQLKDTKSGKEHVLRREKLKGLKTVLESLKASKTIDLKQFVKAVEKHGIYGDEIDRKATHLDAKLLRIYEIYDYDEIRDDVTDNLTGLRLKKAWTLDAIKAIYDGESDFIEIQDAEKLAKKSEMKAIRQNEKDDKIALKNYDKLEKFKQKFAEKLEKKSA
jgi:hypothetical protein